MVPEHLGGFGRQRRIDVDRDGLDQPFLDQFLDAHDELLGPPDGEGRHDDLAPVGQGVSD